MRTHSQTAVLLTGGTFGIGLSSAKVLAAAGVRHFLLVGRSADQARLTAKTLSATAPRLDVRAVYANPTISNGATAAAACVQAFRRIDALVSSAGGNTKPRLLHEIFIQNVQEIIGRIMSGVILSACAILPQMMNRATDRLSASFLMREK